MKSHIINLSVAVLVVVFIVTVEGGVVKRSFVQMGCMGENDKSAFAYLDRICEECYNLFREPGLHHQCRSYCFKNDYFEGCVKALLLEEEKALIDQRVNKLFGGS
ncbi:hypothetical protein CHUAL_006811 [Chamberlinius hualienensis]